MGEAGVEPARFLGRRILSPLRLPFRHSPVASIFRRIDRFGKGQCERSKFAGQLYE